MGLGQEQKPFIWQHLYCFCFFLKTVMNDLNKWLVVTLVENKIGKDDYVYKRQQAVTSKE